MKKKDWQKNHAEHMASSYIGIWIAGIGVIARHFIDPGNAKLGYILSGVMAVILIPFMKRMLRSRFPA